MRIISIKEVKSLMARGINTFSRKDNSVRGIETISAGDVQVGDKILIDNYFALVVEVRDSE